MRTVVFIFFIFFISMVASHAQKIVYNSNSTAYNSAVELDNGNIFIAFTNSNQGEFVIYNHDSLGANPVSSPTVFESGQVSHVSSACLVDGNVVIVYTVYLGGGQSKGKFLICDPQGNMVKVPTVFNESRVLYNSVSALSDGNFVIAYIEEGSYRGVFRIYTPSGTLSNDIEFESEMTMRVKVVTLPDENFMIAYLYTENLTTSYLVFATYGLSGDLILSSAIIDSFHITASPLTLPVSVLANGNIVMAYNKYSGTSFTYSGYYLIYDPDDGNLVGAPVVFFQGEAWEITTVITNNDNIVIIYSYYDLINTDQIWYSFFTIYNQSGDNLQAEIKYSDDRASYVSAGMMGEHLFIAYRDEGDQGFGTLVVYPNGGVSSIDSPPVLADGYQLHQNYPNPFNPSTTITYSLVKGEFVSLTIYDLLGHKIATLVNKKVPAGVHHLKWNAKNLSAGVYIYHLNTGNFSQTRKMVLLK